MDTGLRGQRVLITGASGGIGSATARAFAAEGSVLFLHYHTNHAAINALCREAPGNCTPLQADLTSEEHTAAMFEEALARCSRIDVLVVNAGIWTADPTPICNMTLNQWQRTLSADLTSAFLCCRAFMRHLAESPRETAAVVLVGSTAGLFGEANHADYAAAKAGMAHGLTASLKNEIIKLAPRGRVNCVCPGWTATPMAGSTISDPEAVRSATATMALRKIATPQDVASAIVFLSSEKLAGHISGAILPVTGGMEGRLIHG